MEPLNTVSSMVSDSEPVGHCAHGWRPPCPKRCRSRRGPSCWPARFSSGRGGRCRCRVPEPEPELPVLCGGAAALSARGRGACVGAACGTVPALPELPAASFAQGSLPVALR